MMAVGERWHRIAAVGRERWNRHHQSLLCLLVIFLCVIAALRLAKAFPVLLWGVGPGDAVDLRQRHLEVHRWFASMPVYSEFHFAVYPPATYLILWPVLGWLEITTARWLWAATEAVALIWLAYLVVRKSEANTAVERTFVALLPLSMYATAATIRNGQLIVHLLPLLLAGLLLLQHGKAGWGRDLLSAALVLLALVKPTVSAPFLWLALFLPGRLRPAALVAFGYAALTLFAVLFQELGTVALFQQWLARGSALAVREGTANLHTLLAAVGLEKWILPASLLVFLALGLWTYRHWRVDFWLLLSVSAIVARFWTYHYPYDDLLLLLPEIALFRLVKRGPSSEGSDVAAAVLLAITFIGMLVPLRLLIRPSSLAVFLTGGNAVIWIVVLVFLMRQAGMTAERSANPKLSAGTAG
jgi:hypothetical protein